MANPPFIKAQTRAKSIYSRIFLKILIGAMPILLSACSSLGSKPPQAQIQTNSARVHTDALQLSGRITVRYMQNEKEQIITGGFEWQHDGANVRVNLISPLGQTLARIEKTPLGASLQRSDYPIQTASELDGLLQTNLGWSLPVTGMRDWMQGFVTAANGSLQAVPAQNNALAEADGWQLRYVVWNYDDAPPHPKRIDLRRDTAEFGEINIKILIDQWKAL